MATELLQTKLSIPPLRPALVPRPALLEKLSAGLGSGSVFTNRLTLVSAPAGFGKTTLVRQWLAQLPGDLQVAWLSLDSADNDLPRFLSYLAAALDSAVPGAGETAAAVLQASQPPPAEAILTPLINELAAGEARLILVLDDYHLIESPGVHQAVTFLLDYQPPQLHLVITTRSDPPLPTARLRARRQMTELRAADLRFRAGETAVLLNETMGLNLSSEAVDVLEGRTEGWIAGLQLAALALRGVASAEERLRLIEAFSGSHRFVLDFLVDEVLSQQPEATQTFLWQTAILDRLTGPLCDAVTGGAGSQAMLLALEQANLFIVPLDDQRRWYSYHRLFADLLRVYGRQQNLTQWIECHRRAATWYQAHDLTADAFEHWMQAEAPGEAARLVEERGLSLLNQGQTVTVLGLVDRLPAELVVDRPWLQLFQAWAWLLTGQTAGLASGLAQIERALADYAGDDKTEMSGHLAAIQAYRLVLQGDTLAAVRQAQQALDQLSPGSLGVRSLVGLVLGGMHLVTGDLAAAEVAFLEAGRSGQAAGNRHVAVPAWCALASLQMAQGRLRQAQTTFQDALALATSFQGRPLPLAAQPYNGLAQLAYEWDDLEKAAELLEKSTAASRVWQNPDSFVNGLLTLAMVHQAQGQLDRAEALWAEAAEAAHGLTPPSQSRLAAVRQELWLAEGRLAAASRAAQERGLTVETPDGYTRYWEQVALVQILLAQGQSDLAHELLARLASSAQKEGRTGNLIQLLALQALAYQARGKIEQARQALDRALDLAEPEGYLRTFLDEGQALAGLLAQLPPRPYRDRLLAAFGRSQALEWPGDQPPTTVDRQTEVTSSQTQIPALISPLSEREMEVLQLIAAGLSNQAIADELVVAMGTVKSHTAAIYRKLDVGNRTQAVARARELGLLL